MVLIGRAGWTFVPVALEAELVLDVDDVDLGQVYCGCRTRIALRIPLLDSPEDIPTVGPDDVWLVDRGQTAPGQMGPSGGSASGRTWTSFAQGPLGLDSTSKVTVSPPSEQVETLGWHPGGRSALTVLGEKEGATQAGTQVCRVPEPRYPRRRIPTHDR